jgi:preprotein translocase subunit Sss1
MIEFNININNFLDNKDKPTKEEYAEFANIIAKIKKSI